MDADDGRRLLLDVVKDFDVAMLVTHAAGAMQARPMTIASMDDGAGAYLVTDIDSLKVDEITADPRVLLTFQSARRFACVHGEVTVLRDRETIEKLWKEAWKVWFPDGTADASIALLRFTPHGGEYWDSAGMQGLRFYYDAAKAYMSGRTPQTGDAQHARVRLSGAKRKEDR